MTDDYDHEGTLREISISSADDEEMRAAEWALDEIERLQAALDEIERLRDVLRKIAGSVTTDQADFEGVSPTMADTCANVVRKRWAREALQ